MHSFIIFINNFYKLIIKIIENVHLQHHQSPTQPSQRPNYHSLEGSPFLLPRTVNQANWALLNFLSWASTINGWKSQQYLSTAIALNVKNWNCKHTNSGLPGENEGRCENGRKQGWFFESHSFQPWRINEKREQNPEKRWKCLHIKLEDDEKNRQKAEKKRNFCC